MSWFDASGLASIAKSALKEAQRTIDKALDIKDDDSTSVNASGGAGSLSAPIDVNSEDFFGAWDAVAPPPPTHSSTVSQLIDKTDGEATRPPPDKRQEGGGSSIWGSFTGSFFDASRGDAGMMRSSADDSNSLDDSVDATANHFSLSKLVVEVQRQYSDDDDGVDAGDCRSSEAAEEETIVGNTTTASNDDVDAMTEIVLSGATDPKCSGGASTGLVSTVLSFGGNFADNSSMIPKQHTGVLLSLSHSENAINKTSCSDSVELITCSSTECTTSPESDVLSIGHSISTSSSALGLKQTSTVDSLLTSPSSVEVLISESSSGSRRHSQYTDEFVSPLQSPLNEQNISKSSSSNPLGFGIEQSSPDSVEVIQPDQDEDDASIAEEDTISYTSVSESTSTTATTILDAAFNFYNIKSQPSQQKMRPPAGSQIMIETDLLSSSSSSFTSSPDKKKTFNFVEAITRAPTTSRTTTTSSNMHLPLLLTPSPQITNIIDIPQDQEDHDPVDPQLEKNETTTTDLLLLQQLSESNDDGFQSDRTLIANDSSVNMESGSDTSIAETTSSSSGYLKKLLADAMCEKQQATKVLDDDDDDNARMAAMTTVTSGREPSSSPPPQSSVSSESRSDLVKIGSGAGSGQTSGDELETTTSSDIEIISMSPNGGDSSSTQSRQSPASKQPQHNNNVIQSQPKSKLSTTIKTKGHTRELSEASSSMSDNESTSTSELERLIKKLSEMTEILDSRELKLIDMNRRNADLQERNIDLQNQLDSVLLTKQLESVDLTREVTEEYTQRLSALERKFQQAIRETDTLRKQLASSKVEAGVRATNDALEVAVHERDEVIKELRDEGEKLSKQQLQHSNIIKKLRVKEKENEATIKHLKETIEDLSSETDRLKRSLSAKEEVERSQIEAVHQLTAKNRKNDNEIVKLQSQLDDLNQKYDTVKKSFEGAKKELINKNRTSSELLAREHMLESLANEKRIAQSQNEEIVNQVENLRLKLSETEQNYIEKEHILKNANNELLRRLEDAEQRNEELSQTVMEVSRPLVRQLETLQATHTLKVMQFEQTEQELQIKIAELQMQLDVSGSTERATRDECARIETRLAHIDAQFSTLKHQNGLIQVQLEQQKAERQIVEQNLKREIDELKEKLKSEQKNVQELTKKNTLLLEERRSSSVLEKTSNNKTEDKSDANSEIQESLREVKNEAVSSSTPLNRQTPPTTGSNSPTLSLGKVSISESMGSSSFWSQEEPFDVAQAPRYTNIFEMQMLQTNLRQRDGELQQLQWELNRREQERTLLNLEISSLLKRVDDLDSKMIEFDTIKGQFSKTQQQYDTLCQLYGEKVEENEELKLDLEDVKAMYKSQIDELLKQQKQIN